MNRLRVTDVGVGDYISQEPSTRFPVYTRGNAGEVYPQVVYPLSIGLALADDVDHYARPLLEAGLVTRDDVRGSTTTMGGVFGGYMYLNVSMNRVIAIRSPGITIEDGDRTFLGSDGIAPPHVDHPDDTNRRASLSAVRYAWRTFAATDVPHLRDDRALVDSWQARLPGILAGPTGGLLDALREATPVTMDMFSRHIDVSARAGVAVQVLTKICEDELGDRSLALTMLAGLGEVDSATPAFELWRLGRMVRSDDVLTAHFDAGVNGLAERLAADPAATMFVREFDRFRLHFGSRGPNEWETACETWGTDASLPLTFVDRMRLAGDEHDPALKRTEGSEAGAAAAAAARTGLSRPKRWIFDRVLRAAMVFSPARERSKTIIVDLIHVGRLVTRELGRRCSSQVDGGDLRDVWFVFPDELDAYVADPASFTEVIASRRAVRDELSRREPPFVFDGEIPPADTWPLRDELLDGEAVAIGDVITGIGGCGGVAEGRARVVTDPGDPGELGPGDVLIAPLTDPAWTPLFVPVEAIVVDVGGQMSHAVIVSRELGRPCVVAATGATRRIPDGALVRVDGSAGTVTVLELPT